jgi:hypothetical protein
VRNTEFHNESTATAHFSSERWRYLANPLGIENP